MNRLVLLFVFSLTGCFMPVMAQYLVNQTSYVNVIPQTTFQHVGTVDAGNGATFTGNAVYTNGIHTGYDGIYTYPDHSFLNGRFTTGFQPADGFHTLVGDGGKQWSLEYRNGRVINRTEVPVQNSAGNGYLGPVPVSGYTNPVDNHTATCAGCRSSGNCQHCGGRGYIPGGSECSLCHGSGRCVSCGGRGWVRL